MLNVLLSLAVATVWILKISFLPKLYHALSSKRDVTIKLQRKLEKLGLKLVKLNLDVKYFETCIDLDICPKF